MKVSKTITTIFIGFGLLITAFGQQNDRTLKDKKWKNEPLEITGLKIKEKKVKFKENFVGDDDWFRDLKVEVKNKSDKTVVFIDLSLIFPANEAVPQNVPASDHLLYGHYPPMPGEAFTLHPDQPSLKPGDTATLSLKDYEGTRRFLNQVNKPQSIKEIEIEISEVYFDDETRWSRGSWHKRNPNAPNKWLPEKKSDGLFKSQEQLNLLFSRASFDWLSFSDKPSSDTYPCNYERFTPDDFYCKTRSGKVTRCAVRMDWKSEESLPWGTPNAWIFVSRDDKCVNRDTGIACDDLFMYVTFKDKTCDFWTEEECKSNMSSSAEADPVPCEPLCPDVDGDGWTTCAGDCKVFGSRLLSRCA